MLQRISLPNLILTLATALLLAGPAEALLVLTLDDPAVGSGPEVIIADNQAVGTLTAMGATNQVDGSGNPGVIASIGPVSVFGLSLAVATSKPASGSPTQALLDLSVFAGSNGPGTLIISLTDTDYSLATQPGAHVLDFVALGTADGTVEARTTLDPANAEFGFSATSVVLPPFPASAFSAEGTVPAPLGPAPFSLSQQVKIVHSGAGPFLSQVTGHTKVELPCPCFDDEGPEPTFCFDRHVPSLNSWAFAAPSSFLQVTNLWCRDNPLFQWIAPNEAIACDAALHRRCNPDPN